MILKYLLCFLYVFIDVGYFFKVLKVILINILYDIRKFIYILCEFY